MPIFSIRNLLWFFAALGLIGLGTFAYLNPSSLPATVTDNDYVARILSTPEPETLEPAVAKPEFSTATRATVVLVESASATSEQTVLVQDDYLASQNQALLVSTMDYDDREAKALTTNWQELARYPKSVTGFSTQVANFQTNQNELAAILYQEPTTGKTYELTVEESTIIPLGNNPQLQAGKLVYPYLRSDDVANPQTVRNGYGPGLTYEILEPKIYLRTLDLATLEITDASIDLPAETVSGSWTMSYVPQGVLHEESYLVLFEFKGFENIDPTPPQQFVYNLSTQEYEDIPANEIPTRQYRTERTSLYQADTLLNQFDLRSGLGLVLTNYTPERLYLAANGPATEIVIATNILSYDLQTQAVEVAFENNYSRTALVDLAGATSDFYLYAPLLVDLESLPELSLD